MTNKQTILAGIIIFTLILAIGYFLKPDQEEFKDNISENTIQKLTVDEISERHEAVRNIMA